MIQAYPGSKSRILDFSQYVPKLGSTECGAIVTASKGPTDESTLITTRGQLRDVFGPVSATNSGLLSVKGYLDRGGVLYVVRVAGYAEAAAAVEITDSLSNVSVDVTAVYTGTHGHNIDVIISAGSNGGSYYKIQVYYESKIEDTIDNVLVGLANEDSDDYIETRVNGESDLITVVDNTAYDTMTAGTYTLTGGDDGESVTDADVIGASSGLTRTGMQQFSNPDDVDVNILIAPGLDTANVIAAMATIAENRNDCTYLVAPPTGYTLAQAIAWHNGTGPGGDDPSAALNDWRGAAYWPWLNVYDQDTDSILTVSPVGHVAGVYAHTDDVSYKWRAPAGPRRGVLRNVRSVEYNVDNDQHGQMCPVSGGSGQNNLNPIRNISGEGIQVYSQKTLQRASTSLRDVNVARLMLYVMKVITTATQYLRWEPNDEVSWRQFERMVNPELESISGTRGLYNFTVVCEEYMKQRSDLIDNDTMLGQLFISPVRTVEVLVHDFILTPYNATFDI